MDVLLTERTELGQRLGILSVSKLPSYFHTGKTLLGRYVNVGLPQAKPLTQGSCYHQMSYIGFSPAAMWALMISSISSVLAWSNAVFPS